MRPIALPAEPLPDPLADPLALAVVAEMGERGYDAVMVEDVVARAGVPVEEFHRRYRDLDECALDTYERLIAVFERRVLGAFNRHDEWRDALRAAAYETADFFEEIPYLPQFGLTEALRTRNELVRVRREEVFVRCAEMIERGREAAPDPSAVPEGASIVAIGSIMQLFTHRLQQGAEIDYYEAIRESMYGVVHIYFGEEAAREELSLSRPLPMGAVG